MSSSQVVRRPGLSEEFEGEAGEQLGNLPQAFSHIGLVNAAWTISQAEQDGVAQPATTVVGTSLRGGHDAGKDAS